MMDEQAVADRKARVEMAGAPRFEQQHSRARVLGQAGGEHRASGPRPDDDVVVLLQAPPPRLLIAGTPPRRGREKNTSPLLFKEGWREATGWFCFRFHHPACYRRHPSSGRRGKFFYLYAAARKFSGFTATALFSTCT